MGRDLTHQHVVFRGQRLVFELFELHLHILLTPQQKTYPGIEDRDECGHRALQNQLCIPLVLTHKVELDDPFVPIGVGSKQIEDHHNHHTPQTGQTDGARIVLITAHSALHNRHQQKREQDIEEQLRGNLKGSGRVVEELVVIELHAIEHVDTIQAIVATCAARCIDIHLHAIAMLQAEPADTLLRHIDRIAIHIDQVTIAIGRNRQLGHTGVLDVSSGNTRSPLILLIAKEQHQVGKVDDHRYGHSDQQVNPMFCAGAFHLLATLEVSTS